jgi:ASCH domain
MEELTFKAISVRDPWARAIFAGKDVENRQWFTNYRGPLLIHCGLRVDEEAKHIAKRVAHIPQRGGHVIGIVQLLDCTIDFPSDWAEKNAYHWVLTHASLLSKPFPYRGKLGLMTIYKSEIPAGSMKELRDWLKRHTSR